MPLFQSNLRKQIRKLLKILKSVKIIHYYSLSFIRVLTRCAASRPAGNLHGLPVEQGAGPPRQYAIDLEHPIDLRERGPKLFVGRLRLEDEQERHQETDDADFDFAHIKSLHYQISALPRYKRGGLCKEALREHLTSQLCSPASGQRTWTFTASCAPSFGMPANPAIPPAVQSAVRPFCKCTIEPTETTHEIRGASKSARLGSPNHEARRSISV